MMKVFAVISQGLLLVSSSALTAVDMGRGAFGEFWMEKSEVKVSKQHGRSIPNSPCKNVEKGVNTTGMAVIV